MSYIPITDNDVIEMLKVIKSKSIDELFDIVPEKFRLDYEKFNIPASYSEQEVFSFLNSIGDSNYASSNKTFIGGGAYDHYVPKIVDFLAHRSEFYTAYTPYQPEVSQGTLQYLYEFQSMICELSGMDISNASLYDGASAVAEACSMSIAVNSKRKILISSSVNLHYLSVLKSYFSYNNVDIQLINSNNGITDIQDLESKIDDEVTCIVIQTPNRFGLLEDWSDFSKYKEKYPKLLIVGVSDPQSLSIIKSPGECDCDVYVGEGQTLGNYLSFGGPYIGLFAAKEKYARKMPGRIIGRTEDVDGKEGFVMTLQTREQHIRRDRATSNICTNQGLIALRCTIYMTLLGYKGLPNIAEICFQNSQYAASEISKLENFKVYFNDHNFIKEFVVETKYSVKKLVCDAAKNGYNLAQLNGDKTDSLVLLAFTEKYNKNDINKFISYLKNYNQ
tara:strand:- start:3530 stop:4870 length:1341 start_codon:yes stop_codon:yes gene_type:complete